MAQRRRRGGNMNPVEFTKGHGKSIDDADLGYINCKILLGAVLNTMVQDAKGGEIDVSEEEFALAASITRLLGGRPSRCLVGIRAAKTAQPKAQEEAPSQTRRAHRQLARFYNVLTGAVTASVM